MNVSTYLYPPSRDEWGLLSSVVPDGVVSSTSPHHLINHSEPSMVAFPSSVIGWEATPQTDFLLF